MLKFGIVGYGKMGKIRERTLRSFASVEIIGIFDINQIEYKDCAKICESYDELLNLGVDAVVIATYVKFSAEYTIKALEMGIHVFCEKPPAMTLSEMEQVIVAERRSSAILKYGFNHRYHHSVIQAKTIIDSGGTGKCLWMKGTYGKAGSIDYDTNWRAYMQYSGGGIFLDQGIHMVDLIRYFAGSEFNVLFSEISNSYWKIQAEDNAFLVLKNSSGVIATVHSSATHWKHRFLLEMMFENASITLDGLLTTTGSYAPETLVHCYRQHSNASIAMGKPVEMSMTFDADDSWALELAEFIDVCQSGGPVINGTSSDALAVMKIVDRVYESRNIFV